jgi:hypothetical protein
VANAWDILDWRLTAWIQKTDFRVPSVQAKAAREVAEWLQLTPDPVLAEVWMRTACDRLGITEQSFRRLMRPAVSPPNRFSQDGESTPTSPQTPNSTQKLLRLNEQQIVSAILVDPSLAVAYAHILEGMELHDKDCGEILKWCFARRKNGEDCSLDQALQDFSDHPASGWLDKLRLLSFDSPRLELERALEARPHNVECAVRDSTKGNGAVSDAELERFRRSVQISPSRNQT